jgi:uncharacterized phiE125 gp8 family phage protein
MRLQLVTAPTATPLSLPEAKVHLAETSTDRDADITAKLAEAIASLDGPNGELGRALCTQTWRLLLDAFPDGGIIPIPLPPLRSVASVKYLDADGVEQTLATSVYGVDAASQPGVVHLKYGQQWPTTLDQRNAVTVEFECGYGTADDVPAPLKAAIKLRLGDLMANKEAQGEPLAENKAVERLLFPYRLLCP